MIENIPTPLVSFAGSGVPGFFMGMFSRRVLKFLVIIIGSRYSPAGNIVARRFSRDVECLRYRIYKHSDIQTYLYRYAYICGYDKRSKE